MVFLKRLLARLRRWWRLRNAIFLGFTPLGADPYEHDIEFVSRWDIAETGLRCRRCQQMVADRARFGQVQTFVFSDGTINEGICCPNTVERNGVEQPCGLLMLASPDTEHGDHLRSTPFVGMLDFVRKTRREALAEQYDPGVKMTEAPQGEVLSSQDITPLHPKD
jgi:hypothetical protein